MILPSAIYAVITVLLAFVDALRIKHAQGKEENISHGLSGILAIVPALGIVMVYYDLNVSTEWKEMSLCLPAFVAIRFLVYDLMLNIFRHLPIDYESATTSAKTDNLTIGITFWEKRLFAAVGWGVVLIAYHLIFKSW